MRWIFSVFVVLVLIAGLWWMEQQRQAELAPEPDLDIPAEPEQPEPRYPLPDPEPEPLPTPDDITEDDSRETSDTSPETKPEPEPPLPDLADSDTAAVQTLASLLGNEFVRQRIKPEFVIPRGVSLVNSLDGEAPAIKSRPVQTLDDEPLTEETGDGETLLWTEANSARYEDLVAAIEAVPPEEAAANYTRYYPLFQQAWDELGEPEPYFNDRLIDVIDHLLATPQVELPFEVTPYEGRLHFADESLQEQTWGRKLLFRMGPDHAQRVKTWLEEFRQAVTDQPGRATDE